MIQVSYLTFLSFFIYLAILLGIGIYFYLKTQSSTDFVLGGRSLGAWVTAMSAFASDMSGWLLMGLPGLAYSKGLMGPFWIVLGLIIGSVSNWVVIAKRLRQYTALNGDSHTISDYFEQRFHDHQKHRLRVLSSLIIIFFFIIYTSAQFVAGAKLFETILGLNYHVGLLIMVASITTYIFLGGYLAVCWTDLFQGILMLFALILVPTVAISYIGQDHLMSSFYELKEKQLLNIFGIPFDPNIPNTGFPLLEIISFSCWGLGYLGQPHILVRFMGIESTDKLSKASLIASIWTSSSMFLAIGIGLIGIPFVKMYGPFSGFEPERIFILLINHTMNPFIGGFMLAAILAAAQSTAASQLLVASSSLIEDVVKLIIARFNLQNKGEQLVLNDKTLLWLNRVAVILIMIASAILANNTSQNILTIVAYAWAGLGASLGPIIILSLYWRRMTRNGAMAGMLIGCPTVIIWKEFLSPLGGIFSLYELLPGFLFSLVGIIVVSLLDKKPHDKMIQDFDRTFAIK